MCDHNRFKQRLGQGLCLLCKVNNKMIRELINELKKDDGNGDGNGNGNGSGEPITPPDPDPDDPDGSIPWTPLEPSTPITPPSGDLGATPDVATFPLMIRTSSFMYPEGATSTQGVELPISLEVRPLMTLPDGYSIDWFLERNGERVADASGLALDGVQVTYPNGGLLLTLKGTDNWMSHDYSFHLAQDAPMCGVVLRTLDPVGLIKEAGSMDNQIAIQFFSNKIYEYEFHCDVVQGRGYAALTVPVELPKHIVKLDNMFSDNTLFNDETLMGWDVRHVKSMQATFKNCPTLAQLFWKWNVQNVENVDYMFSGCTNLNVDFRLWCVPKILTTPIDFALYTSQHPDYLPVWGTCPSSLENVFVEPLDPLTGNPLTRAQDLEINFNSGKDLVLTIDRDGLGPIMYNVADYENFSAALHQGDVVNSIAFIEYPSGIGSLASNTSQYIDSLCGINEDGSINNPLGGRVNVLDKEILSDFPYLPPHTVRSKITTLILHPTEDSEGMYEDLYYSFRGSETGLPLTIQSNAIIDLGQIAPWESGE